MLNKPINQPQNSSNVPNTAYIIELSRWGISNDGSNPSTTTKGINDALVWANQNGYTYVKLPAGTYTVGKGIKELDLSVNACIQPQSNTTLDLYGCIIKKETNGWESYRTFYILNKSNVTILGGNVVGDYLTHDYTSPGIHEGAIGVHVSGGNNITFDGMDISGFPGYSVNFAGNGGQVAATSSADWESGTLSKVDGSLVTNVNYMRMNRYITLASMKYQPETQYAVERGTDLTGAFYIWGNGYGAYATRYDGKPANFSTVVFELHFYDNANVYKGVLLSRGFDPIWLANVPTGATQFKIACRYDLTKLIPSTIMLQIQATNISRGIRALNCKIHDGYALAIAVTGSQHILIDQCEMYNIGFAQAKMGRRLYPFPMAIDIEDLTNANQHIIIRSCIFRNNESLHISVVHGRNITFEYNKFDPIAGGNSGVAFQGSRGTSLVSRYNTYTGCTAGGEGAGFVHFHRDNFIEANIGVNFESIYEGCIFDNTAFQMVMSTQDIFSPTVKYTIASVVLPTTLNGFYYVCVAKTADDVTQIEPDWSQALTEGAEVVSNGFTWRAFAYDPIYNKVTMKDCKFNFNKPDLSFAWLNRRGIAEFINCKFNVICQSGFFSDSSTAWDYIGNNEWIFKDCEVTSDSTFGILKGRKVSIERTKLKGPSNSVYPISNITTDDLLISDCVFENFCSVFQGRANNNLKNLRFMNNISTINKSIRIFGSNNEGLYIQNFDNTFIENNKFFMKNSTILNRPLTIYAEKFLQITDNYFESANNSNNIELFAANRTGTGYTSLALPKTVEFFDKNSIVKIGIQKDTGYTLQIGKTMGNGFTDLNSTSVGSTDRTASIPSSGSYTLGQIIYNSTPVAGGYIGWICITAGIANIQSWAANTAYTVGTRINANNHVYEVTVAGTSASVGLTWTTTSGATITNGTVTWKEVGTLAVFKEFGLISG